MAQPAAVKRQRTHQELADLIHYAYFDHYDHEKKHTSVADFRRKLDEYGVANEELSQRLFRDGDKEKTGFISLDNFADVMGYDRRHLIDRMEKERTALPRDVEVISSDMPVDTQRQVVGIFREGFAKFHKDNEVAKFVKTQMEKHHDRLWHVVVIQGQYGSYYSHEPTQSFVFKLGRHICLAWRTPVY